MNDNLRPDNMQRITTKEPDDSMIECAIAAMKEVIPEDGSDRI